MPSRADDKNYVFSSIELKSPVLLKLDVQGWGGENF